MLLVKCDMLRIMKRSLLSRLRTNGVYYLVGALLLVVGIPLFQALILNPEGYSKALSGPDVSTLSAYLSWIGQHKLLFFVYRLVLAGAFALFLTLPFSLFRIIVAQEIMAQQEQTEEDTGDREAASDQAATRQEGTQPVSGMPADAWRGKGFAVLAAWAGLVGLVVYILGTIASTLYLVSESDGFTSGALVPDAIVTLTSIFSIVINTAGIGLIALSTLFFGAMIARGGLRLWPGMWVAFGYAAIAVTALSSGSAVALASAPLGQSPLTTPAIFLFALWALWFAVMLVRLKPES